MTAAEKLRFLADRSEDGKEFMIHDISYRLKNGRFQCLWSEGKLVEKWIPEVLTIDDLLVSECPFKLKPQWEFTEDEKVILRNLPDGYQWIARDADKALIAYTDEPIKKTVMFGGKGEFVDLTMFKHLFQSIQWSDDEPCEFRKYL